MTVTATDVDLLAELLTDPIPCEALSHSGPQAPAVMWVRVQCPACKHRWVSAHCDPCCDELTRHWTCSITANAKGKCATCGAATPARAWTLDVFPIRGAR